MLILHDMHDVPVNTYPAAQVKQIKDPVEFLVHVAQFAIWVEHRTQTELPVGLG
jgi:hypothetical protein